MAPNNIVSSNSRNYTVRDICACMHEWISGVASLHKLVGHNLGLTKDNGIMSSPQASSSLLEHTC